MKVSFKALQLVYSILWYTTNCHSPLENNSVQTHRQYHKCIVKPYEISFQWVDWEYPYVITFI